MPMITFRTLDGLESVEPLHHNPPRVFERPFLPRKEMLHESFGWLEKIIDPYGRARRYELREVRSSFRAPSGLLYVELPDDQLRVLEQKLADANATIARLERELGEANAQFIDESDY